MSKGYTTRQAIENYLLITIDPSFYTQVDTWIEEIEDYIDQITGRNFKADANASARYYDGGNSSKLLIDDAVAITEVKIGDTVMAKDSDPLLADGDYILYPANRLPITRIQLRGAYFPSSPLRCVKITGKWGFSVAVPAAIVQAATVLVSGIINYSWNAEGEVKSMSIGRYSVTYKDEKQWQDFDRIKETMALYKKFTF
jgi:hypothetical protein